MNISNKKENNNTDSSATNVKSTYVLTDRLNDIILSPRISEKSVIMTEKGIYTFNVRKDANKTEIIKAIKLIYNVEPVKVNIINYPTKPKRNAKTGKMGSKSGGKKVMVYLKKGDKINLI